MRYLTIWYRGAGVSVSVLVRRCLPPLAQQFFVFVCVQYGPIGVERLFCGIYVIVAANANLNHIFVVPFQVGQGVVVLGDGVEGVPFQARQNGRREKS